MNSTYTACQLSYLKKNYKLAGEELAKRFNLRFRVKKTAQMLRSLGKRLGFKTGRTGCFKKGNIPWNDGTKGLGLMGANKTSFKKGQMPHNWCPVGSEVSPDGYLKVKVAEPNVWKLKHHLIWEKKHGPIPTGMVVRFKDENQRICELQNLEMVSRRVSLRLNQSGYEKLPASLKPTAMTLAKLEVKTFELERR